MDKVCIVNQKYIKENDINTIKAREDMVKTKKAEKSNAFQKIDEEEMKKWNIDIIEDTEETNKIVEIDKNERDEASIVDLMAKMKQL